MPNWSYNSLSVKGTKKEVINFLNNGLKNIRSKERISADMEVKEISSFLYNIKEGKRPLSLRSWLPMPRTFIKYDTTNALEDYKWWKDRMLGKSGLQITPKKTIKKFSAMSEDEIKSAYDEYAKGWNDAKELQAKKYGAVGWYDYNCKTLGTKWNASFEDFEVEEDGNDLIVTMSCSTAWSFPDAWLDTMQRKYPNLNFFCYAWEESYEYNGYFKAGTQDWIENDDDLYSQCRKELGITKENEDELYEALIDLVDEKQSEMYSKFKEFVWNF